MKTDLLSILEIACLSGAVALVGSTVVAGCSSAGSSDGCTAQPDGCSAADSGIPTADAGLPGADAGLPGADSGVPASTAGDSQTPPTGDAVAIGAWIAKGDYKLWACETAAHDGRSPSPHSKNRICSNTKVGAHTTGEYPIGAANVKELYDASGATITGYAFELKTAAGKGDAWYWFEKQGSNVLANGLGNKAGTEKNVCVGCHQGAGSDAQHSGHDIVYTQVK